MIQLFSMFFGEAPFTSIIPPIGTRLTRDESRSLRAGKTNGATKVKDGAAGEGALPLPNTSWSSCCTLLCASGWEPSRCTAQFMEAAVVSCPCHEGHQTQGAGGGETNALTQSFQADSLLFSSPTVFDHQHQP